jgi:tRNA 2-thiouridine synthesizing protein D
MAASKTLTFALMDPPYENPRSTTALRLIDCALRRGYNVNVFAYEGAVSLAFAKQTPHANEMHGRGVGQEDHPNPKDWISALQKEAEKMARNWIGSNAVSASTSAGRANRFRGCGAGARRTFGNSRKNPTTLW